MSTPGDLAPSSLEVENQDEIEQIMNEIEQLQNEMNSLSSPSPEVAAPSPVAASQPPPPVATPAPPIAQAAPPLPPTPTVAPPPPLAPPLAPVAPQAPAAVATPEMAPAPTVASAATPTPKVPAPASPAALSLVPEVEPLFGNSSSAPAPAEPATPAATEMEVEASILKEFSGAGEEPWLQETLAQLTEDSTESESDRLIFKGEDKNPASEETDLVSEFDHALEVEREVARELREAQENSENVESLEEHRLARSRPLNTTGSDGNLSMTIQGNITLKLGHESGDEEIVLSFQEDSILIQLTDGTEFKIPARKKGPKSERKTR